MDPIARDFTFISSSFFLSFLVIQKIEYLYQVLNLRRLESILVSQLEIQDTEPSVNFFSHNIPNRHTDSKRADCPLLFTSDNITHNITIRYSQFVLSNGAFNTSQISYLVLLLFLSELPPCQFARPLKVSCFWSKADESQRCRGHA